MLVYRDLGSRVSDNIPVVGSTALHDQLTIDYEPHGALLGSFKNIGICIWAAHANDESIGAEYTSFVRRMQRAHDRASAIQILMQGAPLPNTDFRRQIEKTSLDWAPQLVGTAIVILGAGFWASAMRAFTTGIRWVVADTRSPLQVFGSLRSTAEWLAPLHSACSTEVGIDELEATLVSLTARSSVARPHRNLGVD